MVCDSEKRVHETWISFWPLQGIIAHVKTVVESLPWFQRELYKKGGISVPEGCHSSTFINNQLGWRRKSWNRKFIFQLTTVAKGRFSKCIFNWPWYWSAVWSVNYIVSELNIWTIKCRCSIFLNFLIYRYHLIGILFWEKISQQPLHGLPWRVIHVPLKMNWNNFKCQDYFSFYDQAKNHNNYPKL